MPKIDIREMKLGWDRTTVVQTSTGGLGDKYQRGVFVTSYVGKGKELEKDLIVFYDPEQLDEFIVSLVEAKLRLGSSEEI